MNLAQESVQVKKAREKLRKQLEEEGKRVTPEALKEMQDKIYRWIERHSRERINLREKNIALYSLFDNDAHSAKTMSKFVQKLRDQISVEVQGSKAKPASLRGRIKRVEE